MVKKVEYRGDWWIPGEDLILNGFLCFTPDDGPLLELFGSLRKNLNDSNPIEVVLGNTTGGNVTLLNCRRTLLKSSLTVTISTYSASFAFVGMHADQVDNIRFKSVVFRPFNLFQWLNTSGLEMHSDVGNFTASYSIPPPIDFGIFTDCKALIRFYHVTSSYHINNRIEAEERCNVRLNYADERTFEEIIADIRIFCGFITLATFEQSYPIEITFIIEEGTVTHQVLCLFHDFAYSARHKHKVDADHLLKYEDVKERFPTLISNWFTEFNRMKPVFYLLLYSFRNKRLFSEDRFLDIAKAVETFHRMTTPNQKIPNSEFEDRRKDILSKVLPRDKDWLSNKLKYANEPTFRERLMDLLNRHRTSYLSSKIDNHGAFCSDVVDSRNYYTHFSDDSESKALKGNELYRLNQKLLGLLITCIYCYLGLEAELLERGLKKNLG